jgi:hypothetical protein
MGEAKRRKLAGTYPTPVEEFVAPGGTVAITFDVAGVEPWTSVLDATKIVEAVERFRKIVGDTPYRPFIRSMGVELAKAKRSGDNEILESSGIMGAWSAFYHPDSGQQMRETISTMLRQTGKAHITWRYSPTNGLAMALSEKFVDLDDIAANAPRGSVTTFIASQNEPPTRPS